MKRNLITFAAALTLGLILIGCAKDEATKTSQAKIGTATYNVPVAFGAISKGGGIDTPAGVVGFVFSALLPDLAPPSDADLKLASTGTGWHNYLHGLLQYNPKDRHSDGAQLLAIRLSDSWMDTNRYKEISGFKVYIPKFETQYEIWTKQRHDGTTFVMSCTIKTQIGKYPYCWIMEDLNGALLSYSYGKDYAEQAEDIDDKVRRLLNSFRTKEK